MRDATASVMSVRLKRGGYSLCIGILGLGVSMSCQANEWKQFATTKEGSSLFTADPKRFPRGGGQRRIKMLVNNPPSVNGGGSIRVEFEVNCSDNRIRTTSRTYFPQQNAEGRAGETYREPNAAYSTPAPSSPEEMVMNIACGRSVTAASSQPDTVTLLVRVEELATAKHNWRALEGWQCFTYVTVGDQAPVKVNVKPQDGGARFFQLKRPPDLTEPIPIRWDAQRQQATGNEVACPWVGNITLADVYASEWRYYFQRKKYGEQTKACLRMGMELKGLPIHDWDKKKLERYASPYHSTSRQVEQICEDLRPDALPQNEDCSIHGLRTRCDSNLYEYVGEVPKKTDLRNAVIARLEGRRAENLKEEKVELREQRLRAKAEADERVLKEQIAANDAQRAAVLAEAKRVAEEEKHRQWLESPEGRKYLASQSQQVQRESELGKDMILVVSPRRRPLQESDAAKYWDCEGLVNKNVIDITFKDLSAVAKVSGLTPPDIRTCAYIQSIFRAQGRTFTVYSVNFYTSPSARKTCLETQKCVNWRDATFVPKDSGMEISYSLTDNRGANLTHACYSLTGKLISPTKQCER